MSYLANAASYGTSQRECGERPKIFSHASVTSRMVGRELRTKLLDQGLIEKAQKNKIRGTKAADAMNLKELGFLHKQIDYFPESLREDARKRYILIQNDRRIDLQEFQINFFN